MNSGREIKIDGLDLDDDADDQLPNSGHENILENPPTDTHLAAERVSTDVDLKKGDRSMELPSKKDKYDLMGEYQEFDLKGDLAPPNNNNNIDTRSE